MESNKRKPTKPKYPLRGKGETVAAPKAQNAPPPNRRPANRNPRSKGPAEITPGVVTLTQTQLDAILNTVGNLVTQNEALQKSQNFKGLQTGEEEANVLTIDTDRVEPSENLLNLLDSNRKQNGPRSKPQSRENPRYSEINGMQNGPKVVEPDEIPGLGSVNDNFRVVAPSAVPGLGSGDPLPAQTSIPKAHMTKAELKRLQWDKERAENETRSAELNPPSYQAGVRDGSRGMARDVSGNQAPHNITPVRQGAANSKAESKRLQWERERAENAARDSEMNRAALASRAPDPVGQSPVTNHTVAGPVGGAQRGPMSKAEQKRLQWEKERAEAAGMQEWGSSPQRINVEQQPNSSQFVANPLMSKSEVKRLQWQKEKDDMQKAEQQQEYSPWGRPGAGAPIRDTNGQVLTDYNQRKVSEAKPGTTPPPRALPLRSQWRV